jgi:hypothetical protein
MNEKENKRSVPGAGGQNPAPRESLSMDSIEAPVDVFTVRSRKGQICPLSPDQQGSTVRGGAFPTTARALMPTAFS